GFSMFDEPTAPQLVEAQGAPEDFGDFGGLLLEPLSEEPLAASAQTAPPSAAPKAPTSAPAAPTEWDALGAFSLEPLVEEAPPAPSSAAAKPPEKPAAKPTAQPPLPVAPAAAEFDE